MLSSYTNDVCLVKYSRSKWGAKIQKKIRYVDEQLKQNRPRTQLYNK